MSTLSVFAEGSNYQITQFPNRLATPNPQATQILPGDYFSSGSFGFKGSALLGYFRRIPGVFRHALQGFFSLYTASMRMDAPLLPCPTCPGKRGASRGLINAISSRLNRLCFNFGNYGNHGNSGDFPGTPLFAYQILIQTLLEPYFRRSHPYPSAPQIHPKYTLDAPFYRFCEVQFRCDWVRRESNVTTGRS